MAELSHDQSNELNVALHAAAGVVLAVFGLELMPQAAQGHTRLATSPCVRDTQVDDGGLK